MELTFEPRPIQRVFVLLRDQAPALVELLQPGAPALELSTQAEYDTDQISAARDLAPDCPFVDRVVAHGEHGKLVARLRCSVSYWSLQTISNAVLSARFESPEELIRIHGSAARTDRLARLRVNAPARLHDPLRELLTGLLS